MASYSSNGELSAARANLERALAIIEAVYGPQHPRTAIALHNFSLLQQQLGELSAARANLERALVIFKAVHGGEHPNTLRTSGVLAELRDEPGSAVV